MAKANKQGLLPPAFLIHWRCLVKQYGNENVAHAKLLESWRKRERIPGYATIPEANDLAVEPKPLGWSIHNIIKAAA